MVSGDLVGGFVLNITPQRVIRQIEELVEEDIVADKLAESVHFQRFDDFQSRLAPCPRVVTELMSGTVEERGVVEEAILRSVAMMDIEILQKVWMSEEKDLSPPVQPLAQRHSTPVHILHQFLRCLRSKTPWLVREWRDGLEGGHSNRQFYKFVIKTGRVEWT
jgi:hypothetical protein